MDTRMKFNELRAEMYRSLNTCVSTKAYNRRFWKFLDVLLRIVSFGKCKSFMKRATTLGSWVAFGEDTDLHNPTDHEMLTLVHERRHVLQNSNLTPVIMGILYLLCPLPIGLAYFRYKFEKEAFLDEFVFARKYGYRLDPEHFIKDVSGAGYVWAMPEKWVRKDLTKTLSELR